MGRGLGEMCFWFLCCCVLYWVGRGLGEMYENFTVLLMRIDVVSVCGGAAGLVTALHRLLSIRLIFS